jgi:hypothetical protein
MKIRFDFRFFFAYMLLIGACSGTDGTGPPPPPPPAAPTVSLSKLPGNAMVGDSLQEVATCTNTVAFSVVVVGAIVVPPPPIQCVTTVTFTVVPTVVGPAKVMATATGASGTSPARDSATVNVAARPVTTISVSAPTSIMAGDTLAVPMTTANATSCTPIVTGNATLLDQNGCASYRIIAGVPGTATVSATATGSSGTVNAVPKQITILSRPGLTFRGQIVLLNVQSADSPRGWTVSVSVTGEEKVSAISNDDGTYVLPSVKDGVTRDAILTLVPPSGSRYGPLYLATTTAYSTVNMKWEAIPKSWVIEKGIFAGQSVSVNLKELMSKPADSSAHFLTVSSFGFQGGITSGGFGYYSFASWGRIGFPVKVAFDRTRSTTPLSGADSIRFWEPLNELERVTGRDFVEPANYSDVVGKRGILFYIDSMVAPQGGIGEGPVNLGYPDFVANNPPLPIVLTLRIQTLDYFYNPGEGAFFRIIQHETLHCLGFGHTDLWLSIMGGGSFNDVGSYSESLTVKDVAYIELATEMGLAQTANVTLLGFAESLNGLYVLEQGLPPTNKVILP